jgi:phage terminase Nu1 subunit (DNA packaging protein)
MLNKTKIAIEFGVCERTVENWIKKGCPHTKSASGSLQVRVQLDPAAVRAWLEARTAEKLAGKEVQA